MSSLRHIILPIVRNMVKYVLQSVKLATNCDVYLAGLRLTKSLGISYIICRAQTMLSEVIVEFGSEYAPF